MTDESSVKVAIRIRPQSAKERMDMCQVCTSVTPGEPQVTLGKDKSFTYDLVYDLDSQQEQLYDGCAKSLIEGTFEGYNGTIFAYGQTGSGKTYTMGTGFDINLMDHEVGIIPRAVNHLFFGIEERKKAALERGDPAPDFKVNAQFMELYNEEILDLLDMTRDPTDRNRKSNVKIHEDASGSIYTVGVTTRSVLSAEDTMNCLKAGALSRTTASTAMNAQSSRSHAIFTLHIRQQRVFREPCTDEQTADDTTGGGGEEGEHDTAQLSCLDNTEYETLTAKFHFVDLAGSERLKRTGATGDRAKEGISINCGLLALGNVISALGDKTKRGCHVPYRDSKLTRLLQDSLGGNSLTVMIACISPSDRDFMETLNTMKYANRARNIQNKVSVNQDKTSKQLSALRAEILQLQNEILEYKSGKRVVDADGVEGVNDLFHENSMLQAENDKLRTRIKALQQTIDQLNASSASLRAQRDVEHIANLPDEAQEGEVAKLVSGYISEIEGLRSRLIEAESASEVLRRSVSRSVSRAAVSPMRMMSVVAGAPSVLNTGSGVAAGAPDAFLSVSPERHASNLIQEARKDVLQLKRKTRRRKTSHSERESEDEKQDIEDSERHPDEGSEDKDDENNDTNKDEDSDSEDEEIDDNEDEEMDIDSSGVSDSDDDAETNHEKLADLQCEISIKEKLIEELELSQKRLQTMRLQYEKKVIDLQEQIKTTESERDKVLSNFDSRENNTNTQVKKVKEDFERKLAHMQNELKKLQAAKKEHAKLMKNRAQNEKQLSTVQRELTEMKRTKVKLMNQIKENAAHNRELETKRSREMAQIKKEQRRKDNLIKTLESDKRQRDIVLRRKIEEMESMKKRQKPALSTRSAGRVPQRPVYVSTVSSSAVSTPVTPRTKNHIPATPASHRRRNSYTTKVAKQKWDSLEKSVSAVIMKKVTLSRMEKDMNRWLKQREKLSKKLEKINEKKLSGEVEDLDSFNEQIVALTENINYTQENIHECQANIVELEETKDVDAEPAAALASCNSLSEARYLLDRLLQLVMERGLLAERRQAEKRELLAQMHAERADSSFQREMIQYLMQERSDPDSLVLPPPMQDALPNVYDSESSSAGSSRAASPVLLNGNEVESGYHLPTHVPTSTQLGSSSQSMDSKESLASRKSKARRKTSTPEELLYANSAAPVPGLLAESTLSPLVEESPRPVDQPDHAPSVSTMVQGSAAAAAQSRVNQTHGTAGAAPYTSAPHPAGGVQPRSTVLPPSPSPTLAHRTYASGISGAATISQNGELTAATAGSASSAPAVPPLSPSSAVPQQQPSIATASPRLQRRNITGGSNTSIPSHQSSLDTCDITPPPSPTQQRRKDNVFSRLTSTIPPSPYQNRGRITSSAGSRVARSSPLVHTHTAEGHSRAVLSVYATEQLLFSAGKDKCAKVWDLGSASELLTLDGHPNNVNVVRYAEDTRLVYTSSAYFIKVWDVRRGAHCIKTLASSGLASDGAIVVPDSRQVVCPPGETNINDVALNSTGTVLYSAAGNTVRLWDLRTFRCVGKLSGGHQAAVMVLAVDDTDTADGNICVVTGSKDHYIKVFEVDEDSVGSLSPKYNLDPPHYDGIQSLCLMGDLLFSGSRDTCIKKWDLSEQRLVKSMNNSHKDWVCGLAFMPGGNCLMSGCRGGYIKLWHIDNCSQLGEVRAHQSPINAITTNSTHVFTASNDRTVRIWLPRGSLEGSECSDGE